MANRYVLKVQRIEELFVEVEANSLEDAKFFVETQRGSAMQYRMPHGHGLVAALRDFKTPIKYHTVGTGTWPKT